MENVCCNKPSTQFATYTAGDFVTINYYHCESCSNFSISSEHAFTTAKEIELKLQNKFNNIKTDYDIYQRLCSLNKIDSDINVNNCMTTYLELPEKEDNDQWLFDFTLLENYLLHN
jgi:hypothetical protein